MPCLISLQVAQLEAELNKLHERNATFDKQASVVREKEGRLSAMQGKTTTLKEALQKEKLEKLQMVQTIQELEKKIKGLKDNQHALEVILKEKQETALEKDQNLKQLKQKTHKLSEKVIPMSMHEHC